MKRFEISFIAECEDDSSLSDISVELDKQLRHWIDNDESSVLRCYMRDIEELDD